MGMVWKSWGDSEIHIWVFTGVLIFRHWLKFSEFTFVYTHVNCDHIYMYFSPCCYLTWHTLGRFCDAEVRYEIVHRQQNILQVTFTRFHREGKGSRSVMSDPHRPHGLQSTRFLCAWDFPGKSTGVGCHCLLPDSTGGRNKDEAKNSAFLLESKPQCYFWLSDPKENKLNMIQFYHCLLLVW